MRRNAALEGLDDLAQLENAAGSNAANLQRLEETARPTGQPRDKARFDTPNALATAVGASFILGPVGGILLGAAQGILGKREQQNALDQWAADQGVMGDIGQVFTDELDRWETTTTDPKDLDQLAKFRADLDIAQRLSMSANPDLQQQGLAMFQQAQADLGAFATEQEAQAIKREADAIERARELDSYQQGVQQSLLDDYDAQSSNYETVVQNSAVAREAIARGNPVDIVASLIQVNKALDPTSVVRPEEAKALGNTGTLIEQATAQLNEWAGTGQAITEKQRRDLVTLVEGIESKARGFQMQRDIRFQERAVDAGLPMKYVNDFTRVHQLPAFKTPEFQQPPNMAEDTFNTIKQAAAPFSDQAIIDGVVGALGYESYQPSSREEQQARASTRTRQRGVN